MTDDPPLRDRLAVQRTELANERTLLAYGRTAIMLVSTGAVIIRFTANPTLAWTIGPLLIIAGLGVAVIGGMRFVRVRRTLR